MDVSRRKKSSNKVHNKQMHLRRRNERVDVSRKIQHYCRYKKYSNKRISKENSIRQVVMYAAEKSIGTEEKEEKLTMFEGNKKHTWSNITDERGTIQIKM